MLTAAHQALLAWRACQVMRQVNYPVEAGEARALLGRLSRLSQYEPIQRFAERQLAQEVEHGR